MAAPLLCTICYNPVLLRSPTEDSDPMTDSAPLLPPTAAAIAAAARALADGRLVAFPTETVYGLGADATSERAVAAIFAAKGRPRFNPLIVHFADREAARREVAFDRRAEALAEAFWPGPLTLVLPRSADSRIALLASAGLDSLAVRMPRHPVAQALLAACRLPVAAPSANVSGKVSPTTAAHVAESLGDRVAAILDGGACPIGLESTVVDLTGTEARLLRPGGVTEEQLAAIIGPLVAPGKRQEDGALKSSGLKSPGMLTSHYAPALPLRLEATAVRPGEALLAFGPAPLPGAAETANLSPAGDLNEAAANLFAMLRALDRPGRAGIAVMPVPDHDLGRAINDRLRRAAAPRPE